MGLPSKELNIYDQNGEELLEAERIGATPILSSLLRGKLDFHYLGLEGFRGQLIRSEAGLNIQFIIDAFAQETTTEEVSSPKPFSLTVGRIQLEDIQFAYLSRC